MGLIILLLSLASPAQGAQISVLTGIENGTIGVGHNKDIKNYAIGGLPLSIGVINDLESLPISVRYAGAILFDFPNTQLSRLGLEMEGRYFFMGGAWKRSTESGPVTVTNVNPHAMALSLKASYGSYNATSANNEDVAITGSVLEVRGGLVYSYQWSDTLCLDLGIESTALSFHSSLDRITPHMVAIQFGSRFFY
ncbi:MAG: hypothetical protein H7249_05710 [Chitinophagaceae bacterium]|nr:hypothetical protein [Oligoflexus sp.]